MSDIETPPTKSKHKRRESKVAKALKQALNPMAISGGNASKSKVKRGGPHKNPPEERSNETENYTEPENVEERPEFTVYMGSEYSLDAVSKGEP